MTALLTGAGFMICEVRDSTEESRRWFERKAVEIARHGSSAMTAQIFLGDDFPQMARNQVRNLAQHRIRTVTCICKA